MWGNKGVFSCATAGFLALLIHILLADTQTSRLPYKLDYCRGVPKRRSSSSGASGGTVFVRLEHRPHTIRLHTKGLVLQVEMMLGSHL